jgi:hypothetical protein
MSVTYTTAAERDAYRARRAVRFSLPEPLLIAASVVAVIGITLASIGRLRAFDEAEESRAVVNLNAVRDSDALEPALATVFANAHWRTWVRSRVSP